MPWYVFSQPSEWMMRKVGTSVTSSGSMSVLRIASSATRSPGNRNLASPYPASVQTTTLPIMTARDTITLLRKNVGNGARRSAFG